MTSQVSRSGTAVPMWPRDSSRTKTPTPKASAVISSSRGTEDLPIAFLLGLSLAITFATDFCSRRVFSRPRPMPTISIPPMTMCPSSPQTTRPMAPTKIATNTGLRRSRTVAAGTLAAAACMADTLEPSTLTS